MLHHHRHDLRGDRAGRPILFDDDHAVGLGEALEHRIGVERAQRAQVDDLRVDALFGQLVGGFERDADADRVADDRDVLALAHDPRLADRQDVVVELGHVEAAAVHQLVLEEHDRILGADRGLEQALRVGRVIRRDHDQAGDAGIPRREVVRMLRTDARRRAVGTAEHDRAAHLAARHVIGLGRRVDDVIDRLQREVEGHELDDRTEATHRRARTDTGKAVFGDRRVDDATLAEFLEQALGDLVSTLILRDFLAHHEDAVVLAHFLGHRITKRFADGRLDHLCAFGDRWVGDADLLGRRDELLRAALGLGGRSPFGNRRCLVVGRRFLRRGVGRIAGTGLGRLRGLGVARALALFEDRRDDGADLHIVGALGDGDRTDRAFVDRFELHRRLVGLDLGEDVARLDAVAFLDEPLGQRALFHRRGERGHLDLDRHQYFSTRTSV